MTAYCAAGLPHSEIPGSMDICSSPRLIAACHVLLRLLMPRHSPCALSSLTCSSQAPYRSPPSASLSACDDASLIPLLLAFHQKTVFDMGTGVTKRFGPCSELSENLGSLENYAGFTKIDEIVVTLHPSGCCSTINFAPFTFPQRGPLCCLTCFLSHCSVFKVQVSDLF